MLLIVKTLRREKGEGERATKLGGFYPSPFTFYPS